MELPQLFVLFDACERKQQRFNHLIIPPDLTWAELVVFVAVAVCFLRVAIHEFGCSAPWHVLMENYEQSKKKTLAFFFEMLPLE